MKKEEASEFSVYTTFSFSTGLYLQVFEVEIKKYIVHGTHSHFISRCIRNQQECPFYDHNSNSFGSNRTPGAHPCEDILLEGLTRVRRKSAFVSVFLDIYSPSSLLRDLDNCFVLYRSSTAVNSHFLLGILRYLQPFTSLKGSVDVS